VRSGGRLGGSRSRRGDRVHDQNDKQGEEAEKAARQTKP
jgi:hypothetical protein